jgi:hypothetical protein
LGFPTESPAIITNSAFLYTNGRGDIGVRNFGNPDSRGGTFLTNCTISGGTFGLLNADGSTAVLTNCTITNTQEGIFIPNLTPNTILKNTIVAGNSRDIGGQLASGSSFNLIGSSSYAGGLVNGVNGNQVGVSNPGLGPLSDNGGPTQTYALLAGSPAIDTGVCDPAVTTDQRGVTRPQGAGCDIGAFELASAPVNQPPTITPAAALTRQRGSAAVSATIATVSDTEDAAGGLSVTAGATPPGISLTGLANSGGEITANVSADCSASLGANTIALTVTDSGGRTATADLTVNVTDNTPPSLGTYPATQVNAGAGTTVMPSAPPSDNSSIQSLTASAPGFSGTLAGNPATGAITITNANPPGSYTVTVTATDNCGATSTATFSLTVTVLYNFSGFFQPVDNPPTVNVAPAGSAIPVKFSLSGNKGLNIFAAGYPVSQQMICNSSSPTGDIEQTVTAGASSLSYDAATDTYTYIWKTDRAWKGTCRKLIVKLNDGSEHVANFQFK